MPNLNENTFGQKSSYDKSESFKEANEILKAVFQVEEESNLIKNKFSKGQKNTGTSLSSGTTTAITRSDLFTFNLSA